MDKNLKYTCSCGCGYGPDHPLSEGKCYRKLATEDLIPINFRQKKNRFNKYIDVCDVNGQTITVYTLKHQRMYAQNKDGTWTLPKDESSLNSLDFK